MGNSALADLLAGNLFLPLILLFVLRAVRRNQRRLPSGQDAAEPEPGPEPEVIEELPSSTFSRERAPAPEPHLEPEAPSRSEITERLLAQLPEQEETEVIDDDSAPAAESGRPMTSAEMVEEAKKRYSGGR